MIPLIETFHSIQGEGAWAGAPMFFIRVAGCNVSKKDGQCKTWDGRLFTCDTYLTANRKLRYKTYDDLLKDVWEKRICLTGGEPLAQPVNELHELFETALRKNLKVHIETNGTLPLPNFFANRNCYIACSPKREFLASTATVADEIRLLVDENFALVNVPPIILSHPHVFLSPVNDGSKILLKNLNYTLRWLERMPNWRLSIQMHKYVGVK